MKDVPCMTVLHSMVDVLRRSFSINLDYIYSPIQRLFQNDFCHFLRVIFIIRFMFGKKYRTHCLEKCTKDALAAHEEEKKNVCILSIYFWKINESQYGQHLFLCLLNTKPVRRHDFVKFGKYLLFSKCSGGGYEPSSTYVVIVFFLEVMVVE